MGKCGLETPHSRTLNCRIKLKDAAMLSIERIPTGRSAFNCDLI
jgi:hypothetical protein